VEMLLLTAAAYRRPVRDDGAVTDQHRGAGTDIKSLNSSQRDLIIIDGV
jgi:hypothetical protein